MGISKQQDKLITDALAIEARDAKEAGALGYMARALVQATMPHSKVTSNQFTRHNGAYTLTMLAPHEIGLPYGSIPRLLISWVTTEAVLTKSPAVELGHTLSGFMAEMGLIPTGGRWGSITSLKEQTRKLFSCSVSLRYEMETREIDEGFRIARKTDLWWDPKQPEQSSFWKSTVTLSQDFFNEIIQNPIPIDVDALKALRKSPLAIDIYCWLTYRMSYLKKYTEIPWSVLEVQFGANYQETRNFKQKFIQQLKKVTLLYPEAKVSIGGSGLVLKPSKPHVPLLQSG